MHLAEIGAVTARFLARIVEHQRLPLVALLLVDRWGTLGLGPEDSRENYIQTSYCGGLIGAPTDHVLDGRLGEFGRCRGQPDVFLTLRLGQLAANRRQLDLAVADALAAAFTLRHSGPAAGVWSVGVSLTRDG